MIFAEMKCPSCSYRVDQLPTDRCPECGHRFDPALLRSEAEVAKGLRSAWIVRLVAVGLCVVASVVSLVGVFDPGWWSVGIVVGIVVGFAVGAVFATAHRKNPGLGVWPSVVLLVLIAIIFGVALPSCAALLFPIA